MSREALQDFLRAVEHHQRLRHQAAACRDDAELVQLARQLGFAVTASDLATDLDESRISEWFTTSRIQRSCHPQHSTDGRRHAAQ